MIPKMKSRSGTPKNRYLWHLNSSLAFFEWIPTILGVLLSPENWPPLAPNPASRDILLSSSSAAAHILPKCFQFIQFWPTICEHVLALSGYWILFASVLPLSVEATYCLWKRGAVSVNDMLSTGRKMAVELCNIKNVVFLSVIFPCTCCDYKYNTLTEQRDLKHELPFCMFSCSSWSFCQFREMEI